MKQATCQDSKYEDGRQINDSEGVCNTEDDDTRPPPIVDPETSQPYKLAYDRRYDLNKCEYKDEDNRGRYTITNPKPYNCEDDEILENCCGPRMKCDSKGLVDYVNEIVMKRPESAYLDPNKSNNICNAAVCLTDDDEGTCCSSKAKCGDTPDPITHPSVSPKPTIPGGSPVPTRTPEAGKTLSIRDEDCGEGYKYNTNSLYKYCEGSVCNPLKVPADKETCCIPDGSTDTVTTDTVTTYNYNCG